MVWPMLHPLERLDAATVGQEKQASPPMKASKMSIEQ